MKIRKSPFIKECKIPLLASEFPPLQRGIKGDLQSLFITSKLETLLLVLINFIFLFLLILTIFKYKEKEGRILVLIFIIHQFCYQYPFFDEEL